MKEWLAERKPRIEVYYLPSDAPELNPHERLSADLRHEIRKRVPVRTKGKLKAAAMEHMTEIEKSPNRIRAYFQDRQGQVRRIETSSCRINRLLIITSLRVS